MLKMEGGTTSKKFLNDILLADPFYEGVNILPSQQKSVESQ